MYAGCTSGSSRARWRRQSDHAKNARAHALGDALIVPPLPAPSRPSKTTQTFSPLASPTAGAARVPRADGQVPSRIPYAELRVRPRISRRRPSLLCRLCHGPPAATAQRLRHTRSGPGSSQIAARNAAPAQRSGCGPDRQYPSALRITSIGGACPVQRSAAARSGPATCQQLRPCAGPRAAGECKQRPPRRLVDGNRRRLRSAAAHPAAAHPQTRAPRRSRPAWRWSPGSRASNA